MDDSLLNAIRLGFKSMAEAMAGLIGIDIRVELPLPEATALGWDALKPFPDGGYLMQTTLVGEGNKATRVGLLAPSAFVKNVGVALMMLPETPDEVTEDIQMAFDEVMNVSIGAWNDVVANEAWHWDNKSDARSIEGFDQEGLRARLGGGGHALVGATLHVEGEAFPFAVYSVVGQMLQADAEVQIPGDSGESSTEADPAVAAESPAAAAPSEPPSTHGARVMIVDHSGTLSAWMNKHLKSPEMAVYRATGDVAAENPGSLIVLVDANPEILGALETMQTLVVRKTG